MKWDQYNKLDFEKQMEIDEIVGERICGEAIEPFLVEPFCAQVSWMKKGECPVYPHNFQGEGICYYMYQEGYETYRCPNVRVAMDVFKPIIEKGDNKQVEALANLARIWKKYSLREETPFEKSEHLAADTIKLLFSLDLIKEGMELLERFPSFGRIISPEDETIRKNLLALDALRRKSGVPFYQWRRLVF